MDSLWAAASQMMDTAVDGILGDRILYARNGASFVELPGFVIDAGSAPASSYDAIDEALATRPRVKIAKQHLDYPAATHRLKHPRLGDAVFKPCGSEPQTQGRYWIFDVQKAST